MGDWLVAARHAADLSERLHQAVRDTDDGLTPAQAAQLLGLPAPELAVALARPPVLHDSGRLRVASAAAEPPASPALVALRGDLARTPFAAPDAGRLTELGLDDHALVRLHRAGALLRLAERVVLLPGAAQQAAARLAELDQPFTTSQARTALGTSRRVVLPLLAHLDKSGLTLRLPDDRRRMRGPR